MTAIILAGGRGARMGGQDKAWMPYRGRPLIEWVLAALTPQVDDIVISCNRNLERYRGLGWPLVQDNLPGFQGPLAGIAAARAHCHCELVQLCPCDVPRLPPDLTERLSRALTERDASAAVPRQGGVEHWLNSLVRRDALGAVLGCLQRDRRSARAWLGELDPAFVDFADAGDPFCNVNRAVQLAP